MGKEVFVLNENIYKQNKLLCRKFLFLLCLLPSIIFSQTVEQLYKAANENLNTGEFYAAAKYFKQALDKDDSQPEIWYGFAEASRLFNDYKNAEQAYEQVIEKDKDKKFPLCNFWLGSMLVNLERYEEAKTHLTAFQNKYRKKDFYAQKVQQLIESCSWAMANSTQDSLEIIHLPDSINSTFSELNPFVSPENKFYYSTTKPTKGKAFRTQMIDAATDQSFLPGIAETSAKHIANGFFSNSKKYGEEIFFTQCNTESGITRCKIFVSHFVNQKWETAKELPVNINLTGYTTTHPNVLNEANGNQWLFFASNRPGTKGKMDIWLSKRLSKTEWDYPQNAGNHINSIDDEVTPFADSNRLYFSSLWHYGYGGFDVFAAEIKALQTADFGKPKNMRKPINSGANEVYFSPYDSVAFFSSNRVGSKFIEAETCCNDIYMVAKERKKETAADTTNQAQKIIPDTVAQVAVTESKVKQEETVVAQNEIPISTAPILPNKTNVTNLNEHITLYFHNDEPNPKTLADTTILSYRDAYESYTNLENEYLKNYAASLPKSDKAIAERVIKIWFADTVEASFHKLVVVAAQVLKQLENGKQVRIKISGYCSPLNFNEYNILLGRRRAASVFNFLFRYRESALQQYIQSGRLKVEMVSNGEETAAKNVSDNLQDTRNSVFSLAAARERRVEILISEN